jgi:sugar phosphate isomerase/epimerase
MENHITRSTFLKLTGAAAFSLPIIGLISCQAKKEGQEQTGEEVKNRSIPFAAHPGLQVYTVREQFEKDASATLKKIASIGYKELELYNQSGLARVQEIRDLGMEVISTHFLPGYISGKWGQANAFGIPTPTDSAESIIEACAKANVRYMGIAILFEDERKSLDDYKVFAEQANKVGEKAKAAGVQLYYHNHSFEFEPINGTTPFNELLNTMDAELVKYELDLFWTTVSGNSPAEWIKKLAGRVKMLHLKDLKTGTPKDYTTFKVDHAAFMPVGDGIVDFNAALTAAQEAGVPYTFVEQDHSALDPFESIARSYSYLKKLGL